MFAHHTKPRAARALRLTLLLLAGVLMQACGKPQERAGFGLELRKPAGWSYVSGGVDGARGDTIRYDAAAIAQALAAQHGAPLFVLLKHAPRAGTFNPTFGINLARDAGLRGQSARALLEARVTEATRQGPFTVTAPVSATQLAGLPAAQAELQLAPAADAAATTPTRVRLQMVVIDDVSLLLAQTDATSGDDDASATFSEIRASLRLPGASPTP